MDQISIVEVDQFCIVVNSHDVEFNMWLDRTNLELDLKRQLNLSTPENDTYTPARVITSRSVEKQSSGFLSQYSKRDIKMMALEGALSELEQP